MPKRPSPTLAGEETANIHPPERPLLQNRPTRYVPLALIDQGEQLIRDDQNDDEIDELALHIQQNGLLQPIGVRPKPDGRYQLLFGARRCAAHRRLRRTDILASIFEPDARPTKAIAAAENLLRRQLTLKEESDAVLDLHERQNLSPDSIASLVGRSRSWVLRRLALPNLPDDLREPVLDGTIPLGAAEALALLPDPAIRAYATQQTRASQLSITEVRQLVASLEATPSLAEAVQAGKDAAAVQQPTQRIYLECEACHARRPPLELRLVRVCTDGCQPQPEDTPHDDTTNPTRRTN